MISCELPTPGWLCTREAGHEGPCAAIPLERHTCPVCGYEGFLSAWDTTGKRHITNGSTWSTDGPEWCTWPRSKWWIRLLRWIVS